MRKSIYHIAAGIVAILGFAACDSLDLSPEDYFGSGNFWKNEAQVNSALIGLHGHLRNSYDMFYVLGELRGGTQRVGTSSLNTSLNYARERSNLLDKDNTGITNWHGLYANIFHVNHFIYQVENNCPFLSEASRKNLLAQAYGFRALYYFMLYKTYGGVPIVTETEVLNGKASAEKFYVERATPQATIEFVKQSILKSEAHYAGIAVANNYAKTNWSKAATLMLKAEIYLWAAKVTIDGYTASGTADLQVAKAALGELMGKFELLNDFGSIFNTANRNNKEVIFALHFSDGEATNNAGSFLYQDAVFINQVYGRDGKKIERDTLNLKGTGGVFRSEYTYDFWQTYDATDTRRDATFLEYYLDSLLTAPKFGCVMKKGVGSVNANNNRVYDTDIIVYRYADALLMMAEVANGLGEPCADYINQIRKRAYGAAYEGKEYTEADFATNELAILHERDKEFVWEGKRWFDVVRMHDASKSSLAFAAAGNYPSNSALINPTEKHKLLWPIDVNTKNINPLLKQTPGY